MILPRAGCCRADAVLIINGYSQNCPLGPVQIDSMPSSQINFTGYKFYCKEQEAEQNA